MNELVPEPGPVPAANNNQAAVRVLSVLASFCGRSGAQSVTDLSRELGLGKTLIHRALTTLVEAGYVVRDPTGSRYELGWRVLLLDQGEEHELDLRAMCRPFMDQLHGLSGESVFLSIIVGQSRVNIDDISARGRRVSHIQRGRPVPLHYTKMSRVLLAFLGDAEIDTYIALASPLDRQAAQFPETAGNTPAELRADIALIRRQGFMVWSNTTFSATYVTFALLDAADRPHGTLTVGGPVERFDLEGAHRLLPQMRAIVEPLRDHLRLFPAPPVFLSFSAVPGTP